MPAIFARTDDGAVAYRGRPVTELTGTPFERVWGLLVDGAASPALPPAEPFHLPAHTGDTRVDLLCALAQLTPAWSFRPLSETDEPGARDNLARASVMALSFVAQSARGRDVPAVPQREIDLAETITDRFLVRWRGEADPAAREALDAFWLAVAETGGLTPSTATVRLAAGAEADAASCLAAGVAVAGAPSLGGAAARSLALVADAELRGDAAAAVGAARALPGFGDDLDHRSGMLREACVRLGVGRLGAADAVAAAVTDQAAEQGRTLRALPIFWGAVLLDHAGVSPALLSALYLCGRTAGWSAHVLEVHAQAGAA